MRELYYVYSTHRHAKMGPCSGYVKAVMEALSALLSGCRLINQLLFPNDSSEAGPTDFQSWELRKDFERSEHGHYQSTGRDHWDE